MTPYVIIVEFWIHPESIDAFRKLIIENARTSLAQEQGCMQFDVLEPEDEHERLVLYEVYRDRSAFDDHLKSPHFLKFAEATVALVQRKKVQSLARSFPI